MGERLIEQWVIDKSGMGASGDAQRIDVLLESELTKVAVADGGWRKLYQHRATGRFWELSYPHGELHGGGPRQLVELSDTTIELWLQADGREGAADFERN